MPAIATTSISLPSFLIVVSCGAALLSKSQRSWCDVLEVPQALAGSRVEGQEAVGEQVGADAVGAVVVVGGRPGREIGDAALRVDRDLAPGIRAADVLLGVLRPRLVAGLAGMRDGVELPYQLAGQRRRRRAGLRAATGSPRRWRTRGGPGSRRSCPACPTECARSSRDPVRALRADRRRRSCRTTVMESAGGGVNLLQIIVHGEDETAILPVLALPIVHARAPTSPACPRGSRFPCRSSRRGR